MYASVGHTYIRGRTSSSQVARHCTPGRPSLLRERHCGHQRVDVIGAIEIPADVDQLAHPHGRHLALGHLAHFRDQLVVADGDRSNAVRRIDALLERPPVRSARPTRSSTARRSRAG